MGELYDWLSHQHPGLKTFKAFRHNMLDRVVTDPPHRALYRLLAALTDEYIARYDGEAVPVEVAEHTYRHLLEVGGKAEKSLTPSVPEQIEALNELAVAKLL